MATAIEIRRAGKADLSGIHNLLRESSLPTEDVDPDLPNFFVAVAAGAIIGSVGMDVSGSIGLLRSLAVKPPYRNKGIAVKLVDQLLSDAAMNDVGNIYLITNTAENFFIKNGFIAVERDSVPGAIRSSAQFNLLCPSAAAILFKKIDHV